MAEMDIQDCIKEIDEIDTLIPEIMKNVDFTTLTDIFGMEINLTMSQFHAFMTISNNDGCSMGSLAENMSLSSATITGLVDRLVKKDLIKRMHDQSDRRMITVWLTEKGKNNFYSYKKMRMKFMELILIKMGNENRENFISLLRSTNQIIKELIKDGKFMELDRFGLWNSQ